MSADTIAYWNSIPLARPESEGISLKRARPEDDDESDDDISIVSRSPSPPPPDAMDVDKYDEYLQVAEREVITVNTKIKNTNKGFSMLAKMGWVEGKPLGLSSEGRVEPVPFYVKNDLTGLGKTNQDVRMIESTVSQRRELDSERQIKETEEQRLARENSVAKKAAVLSSLHYSASLLLRALR
ncbi:G patch domain-containing protein 8 [Grifola frondosa]|uniref:G patch domain-containing protein 8 n=1 Tax=Grifola frondosa TaxID=5627 RepID=A0A1C7MS32_GRIFR|nr:G patch domain-containing protein 8 [Grifola frondosa]